LRRLSCADQQANQEDEVPGMVLCFAFHDVRCFLLMGSFRRKNELPVGASSCNRLNGSPCDLVSALLRQKPAARQRSLA
jgi:hypothetical protein